MNTPGTRAWVPAIHIHARDADRDSSTMLMHDREARARTWGGTWGFEYPRQPAALPRSNARTSRAQQSARRKACAKSRASVRRFAGLRRTRDVEPIGSIASRNAAFGDFKIALSKTPTGTGRTRRHRVACPHQISFVKKIMQGLAALEAIVAPLRIT